MKQLSEDRILAIAAEQSRHVADTGSPGATAHNIHAVAYAIRLA